PEVVKDFDLTETAVRLWLAPAAESPQPQALERDARAELAGLRRGSPRPGGDIEILQRGPAFFPGGAGG
ncbi:transposase, partial [Streptomyces sp. XY593]